MRLQLIGLGLLTPLLLAGCAHGPPPAAPVVTPPTAWALAEGDAAPDWAGLLDPELAALQARALAANRDIAQAALRWRRAVLTADQTALRLRPSAGLSTNASRPLESQGGDRSVDIGGVSVPVATAVGWSHSYGASVSVGYELDLWDRLAQTTAAQRADAAGARTDIAAARLLIRQRVADAYWTLGALAAQQPLAQAQLELSREALALTRRRVAEGKLLPIEVDKAASTVQASESRLADIAADTQLQRHILAQLLDEPLPAADAPALPARLPDGEPPHWRLGDPAGVLAQRPDVQHDRLGVDAALARLRVSEAERYPALSFSATLSTGGTRSSDWFGQPLLSLASNVSVPLIDWQRLNLQRDGARSDLDLAALRLRDTLQKALADIEAQRIEAERVTQLLQANAARLREAAEADRVAEVRYRIGTVARLDWLQARSARLGNEQDRLQLRLRQWQAQSQLFKALGGGSDSSAEQAGADATLAASSTR